MSGESISATDMFCLHLRGAVGDFNRANQEDLVELSMREVFLVEALSEIVKVCGRNRKAKDLALEALELWERQAGPIRQRGN